MKRADIAMIILIGSVSVFISFLISKAIFGDLNDESATVQVIDVFDSELKQPDKRVFNDNAINPTVEITIGGQSKPADNNTKKEEQKKNDNKADENEAEDNTEDQYLEDE